MSISYIKRADKTTSVQAAEKIKKNYINELVENPFLHARLTPISSEGLNMGGGRYRFLTPLGIDIAERRASAPTNSTVEYDGILANHQVDLTVEQPFQTKAFPLEAGDVTQLDGIS